MKKIGDVTSTADKNGEWTNGNVAAGIAPTILDAAWLNSVQREILGVIIAAGLQQDKDDDTQLSKAISKIISGGDYATKTEVNSKLAKDQNGTDIPDKPKFIENLGLPELLDKKFDKTGGAITTTSKAIDIITEAKNAGYIQISDSTGNIIHQLGKISSDNDLSLRNVAEDGTLTVSGDGVRFNGRLLGFINEALSSGNGWWRDSSTGFLIQWGETPPGSDTRQVKFPIPFKEWPHTVVHFDGGWFNNGGATWGAVNKSLTGFTGKTSVAIEGGAFIAMGF